MSKAASFLALLLRTEKAVVLLSFAIMALVIIADVLARMTVGTGFAGAPRIAVFAMIITSFVSFGLASAEGRHLRPKFLDTLLPAQWNPVIDRLQELLMATLCFVFALYAVAAVRETFVLNEVSRMLRIILWPMQAVIPLVFFIASLRHSLYGLYPALRPEPSLKMNSGSKSGPKPGADSTVNLP